MRLSSLLKKIIITLSIVPLFSLAGMNAEQSKLHADKSVDQHGTTTYTKSKVRGSTIIQVVHTDPPKAKIENPKTEVSHPYPVRGSQSTGY